MTIAWKTAHNDTMFTLTPSWTMAQCSLRKKNSFWLNYLYNNLMHFFLLLFCWVLWFFFFLLEDSHPNFGENLTYSHFNSKVCEERQPMKRMHRIVFGLAFTHCSKILKQQRFSCCWKEMLFMINNSFFFKKRWIWVWIPEDRTVMAARPLGCNLSYNRCCRILSLWTLKQMGYTLENVLEVFNFLSSTGDFCSPSSLMLFACLLNPVVLVGVV